jgi:signal transduction histidine kinase/putative methionine-R-sulfoxide reductase with GAF domain/ActR/RegA family two-component response regulator
MPQNNDELLKLHLDIIQYFSKSIFRRNSVDDILWDIASNLIRKLNFVDCVIYILDPERQVLVQKAAYGTKNIDNVQVADPIEIIPGQGIVGFVAVSGKPEIIDDCSMDPRYIIDDAKRLSEICLPIIYENKVIGVIDSEHTDKNFYTAWHLEVLESIAAISATKIAKTLVEEKNEVLARFFNESPNPTLRVSKTGIVLNMNNAARNASGIWKIKENKIGNKSILSAIDASLGNVSISEFEVQSANRKLALWFVPFPAKGYVNIYSSDITEIKHAQLVAEKSSLAKDEFLSVMSHEIRTPLHAILGITTLLQTTELSSTQNDYVSNLEFAGNSLLAQVNDILDVEKIIAGKIEFNNQPFDIRQILRQVVQTFQARSDERKNNIELRVHTEVPSVLKGDDQKFVQVINNLVSNAIKFTFDGEIVLEVRLVGTHHDKTELELQVSDNGVGIPMQKQNKVFEAFEQAEYSTTRKYGGSGLGLTITKKLIELQGGRIALQSEAGKGTTITLNLIFETGTNSGNESTVSGLIDRIQLNPEILKNRKILIVDDNPINLMIAQEFLKNHGAQIHLSNDGIEAIADFQTFLPDIVLMDLQMPDCDGYEAARRIHALESEKVQKTPIIALSADVVARSREIAIEAGMADVISKPFQPDVLLAVINKYLKF